METTFNSITLLGRLGQDPVTRQDNTGTHYTLLSLATNAFNRNTGEEYTQWHRIRVYEPSEIDKVNQLKKGQHCYVMGTMYPLEMERAGKVYHDKEIFSDRIITGIDNAK